MYGAVYNSIVRGRRIGPQSCDAQSAGLRALLAVLFEHDNIGHQASAARSHVLSLR